MAPTGRDPRLGAMSEQPEPRPEAGAGAGPDEGPEPGGDHAELAQLVAEWLDWAAVAERLGVSVAKVRTLIRDHHLAGAAPAAGGGARVPADFLDGGEIVKGLPGVLTLLHDGGYDDRAAIVWLFTDLQLPGRPIDALRENRGSEVKRRAQAMAF